MDVLKKILNVLGILVAIPLSLILVVMLFITPLMSGATAFMQTENLQKIVSEIDFAGMLTEGDWEVSGDPEGIDGEMINALMETKTVNEVIGLYVDGVFAVLTGEADEVEITAETFKNIAEENLDEWVELIEPYIGTEVELSKEEVEALARQMIEEMADSMTEAFPSATDLGVDEELKTAIAMFRDGTVLKGVITVVVVLSVLVLLCQVMRFKGFMWLGVVYMLGAGFSLMVAQGMREVLPMFLLEDAQEMEVLVEPMMSVLMPELYKGTGVLAVLAVVFIAVFVVGRIILKKRNEVQEEVSTGYYV